jgi:hypothetical protein
MPYPPLPVRVPPAQMATFELRNKRAELETRLKGLLSDARRQLIEKELQAVIAEQEERFNACTRDAYRAAYEIMARGEMGV